MAHPGREGGRGLRRAFAFQHHADIGAMPVCLSEKMFRVRNIFINKQLASVVFFLNLPSARPNGGADF